MAVAFDIAAQMRFGDGEGLKRFFLEHRLAHAALAQAIAAQFGLTMPGFDVGDERVRQEWELLMLRVEGAPQVPPAAMKDWALLHSQLHQAEYDAVGFGLAPDLVTVTFADASHFNDWMIEHQLAHDLVGNALGVA